MSRENYVYFKNNLDELLKNQYVVIKNKTIIGAYGSFDEAYGETIKTEQIGTFIIQLCVANDIKNAASFAWNNVMFAQVSV